MAVDASDEKLTCTLASLDAALNHAIYVDEKWPLVHDPTGNAGRFLKYQRGAFLHTGIPTDITPESLRRSLIGGLQYASQLVRLPLDRNS